MDKYQTLRVLGRGSFATVVLVKPLDSEKLQCVKEVDLLRADEKRRAEALREAEVLKLLSHPNIISYHDAFLMEARLCIVMEYADGGDLAGAVARRRAAAQRFLEREAMTIFVQLVLALQYMHARRVLHRDLKTKNVLLMRSGTAKLADFGIAKVLEATDCFAETRIGTPYYLPPEMCTGMPYSYRADIWCLGVVLYELLALAVPFSAPNMPMLALAICHSEPRPVPSVYSSEARALVGCMLAKRHQERPSSTAILALPHMRRAVASLPALYGQPQGAPARGGDSIGESQRKAPELAVAAVDTVQPHTGAVSDWDASAEADLEALLGSNTVAGCAGTAGGDESETGQTLGAIRGALERTVYFDRLLGELELELSSPTPVEG